MKIQCCVCKRMLGVKEPLSDSRISHGYCNECFASEMAEARKIGHSHTNSLANSPVDESTSQRNPSAPGRYAGGKEE